MSAFAERQVRVSTLELFFDLVFVFTITQLTGVLVDGGDAAAIAEVLVMLLLIWWMYDGYAWLTNAIATDRLRHRLLLIGGMGGFLVIALAVHGGASSETRKARRNLEAPPPARGGFAGTRHLLGLGRLLHCRVEAREQHRQYDAAGTEKRR